MATSHSPRTRAHSPYGLHNGDCMMRREFHSLYELMPEGYRAELIGGVVFEPSPVSWSHGKWDAWLGHLFSTYAINTPGVEIGDNATVMLSDEDEPQPDLILRLDEDCGGQSRVNADGYIEGAPELVAEIAYSSRAIDLHLKKERYASAGVTEYIVVCLRPKRLYWFNLRGKIELEVRRNIIRSEVFPGLWVHRDGLLTLDRELMSSTLNKGLKSKEHKVFVEKLAQRAK